MKAFSPNLYIFEEPWYNSRNYFVFVERISFQNQEVLDLYQSLALLYVFCTFVCGSRESIEFPN